MTNLNSILKSRDITLSTKVCLGKAIVFPVVMYGCESWTIKKALVVAQSVSQSVMLTLRPPRTAACQSVLSFTNSWNLFKLISIELVITSNHLILSRPLLLLPSIFPSTRVFSNELAVCIRWPNYWSFSFSISPSYEYSGLISFRIDWFDLLAVQGTLKNLFQHHSSKTSILWGSACFMIQLSYLYVTNGKTIALTIQTFVGKVMSLFFFK